MQLEYLSFIWCTENGALDQKPAANTKAVWKYCCGLLGLDPKPIEACYDSGEGRKVNWLCTSNCSLLLVITQVLELRTTTTSDLECLCSWSLDTLMRPMVWFQQKNMCHGLW